MTATTKVKQEVGSQKSAKQKIKDIKKSLKQISDKSKEYSSLELNLAHAYIEDEQYTEAMKHFKIAENRFDDERNFKLQVEALSGIATCYQVLERYKDEVKYLKAQLEVVMEQFDSQTAKDVAQQQIFCKMGLAFYKRSRQSEREEESKEYIKKALANLEKSMKFIKSSGGTWEDKMAEREVWDCLALVYKAKKDYKKAIECLKEVVPQSDCFDKDALQAYVTIAHCYAKLGKFKKAVAYLEKTVKFMDGDMDLLLRGRVHADLGDYYFTLKDFEKSLHHHRQNLRLFKKTKRFEKDRFDNAVENLRNAKKAVAIKALCKKLEVKLKVATKKGNVQTQKRLLEKLADYAFDVADELKAISLYKQLLLLCTEDTKKTLLINKSIGNAYEALASKQSSDEYAKLSMVFSTKNYDLCESRNDESGMADAIVDKATTLELPFLKTEKNVILKEYKRAAVLATRARNYKLLITIYENIIELCKNWKGKEEQAEEYEDKVAQAKEKLEDEEEAETEEVEDDDEGSDGEVEEEPEEDDEDLCDIEEFLAGRVEQFDSEVMKPKLNSMLERIQARQKSKLIPLQEGMYTKKGQLLPAYRNDFIIGDDEMDIVAKKSLKRLLNKDEPVEVKLELKVEKTETPVKQEKQPSKIEQYLANAKKRLTKRDDDGDESMTPFQEQRKRQRELEEFGELSKSAAKKKRDSSKKPKVDDPPKHYTPSELLIETHLTDKTTGRKVLQNKKTGKILRSFKDDFIVGDNEEDYDSEDQNADFDSDEEEEHKDNQHLPAYTKHFIVDG